MEAVRYLPIAFSWELQFFRESFGASMIPDMRKNFASSRRTWLQICGAVVLTGGLLVGSVAAFVYSGVYDVSATRQHSRAVYKVLELTRTHSVRSHAASTPVPDLSAPGLVERGAVLFVRDCVICHGGPGVPPAAFALGLSPAPPPLAQTAGELAPAELFWVIKHGVKMTGMPAWEFRAVDPDIWAIVAFVRTLPTLSPKDFQASHAATDQTPQSAEGGRS